MLQRALTPDNGELALAEGHMCNVSNSIVQTISKPGELGYLSCCCYAGFRQINACGLTANRLSQLNLWFSKEATRIENTIIRINGGKLCQLFRIPFSPKMIL